MQQRNRYIHHLDRAAQKWLMLAVFALAVGGLLAIVIVALRVPALSALLQSSKIFYPILVIHVNLTTSIWLLSVMAALWNVYLLRSANSAIARKSLNVAPLMAWVGTFAMIISVFFDGTASINNYIPVIDNIVFLVGLSAFFTSIAIVACNVMLSAKVIDLSNVIIERQAINKDRLVNFGLYMLAAVFFISLMSLFFASHGLENKAGTEFYESIFWGIGHLLQFVYSGLMIVAWLILAEKVSMLNYRHHMTFLYILSSLVLFTAPTLLIDLFAPVGSEAYIKFFTWHMYMFGGVASFVAAMIIVDGWNRYITSHAHHHLRSQEDKLYRDTVLCSIFLFLLGSVLGLFIHGGDVTVPAHYHGIVVAITISLMGLLYFIMPRLMHAVISHRLARIQILLYTTGQAIHISTMAISGGYGALRKTPGTSGSGLADFWLAMMGIGGATALAGGLMFVIIVLHATLKRKRIAA